jgi:hypothetical protein
VIRKAPPGHPQFGRAALTVPVGVDLPDVDDLRDEILGYANIILGREDCPIELPAYLALAEMATTYHCRALEIEMLIHDLERDGIVERGSPLYRFRTGSLRSFIELSKKAAELGSRRLTQEQLLHDMRLEQ